MPTYRVLVFYAGMLYQDSLVNSYDWTKPFRGGSLPDGAYVYMREQNHDFTEWYRSDFTPVLLNDVPKEYILLECLLR